MSESELGKNFIELYDKYHAAIYRFLRLKLPNDEVAQDLTSDTFTKAWEYFNKHTSFPDNPRAYLYRMAHNNLVDYYRRRKDEVPMEPPTVEIIDKARRGTSPGSVSEMPDPIQIERLHTALQKLSHSDAQLITLKYIEDFSNKEIAEIVGKNEGTVRVSLHRALKELRRSLSNS